MVADETSTKREANCPVKNAAVRTQDWASVFWKKYTAAYAIREES